MTLKDWREQHGLSRKEVADRLGCSDVTVRQWEVGLRYPRRAALEDISMLTEGAVTPNDFLVAV